MFPRDTMRFMGAMFWIGIATVVGLFVWGLFEIGRWWYRVFG